MEIMNYANKIVGYDKDLELKIEAILTYFNVNVKSVKVANLNTKITSVMITFARKEVPIRVIHALEEMNKHHYISCSDYYMYYNVQTLNFNLEVSFITVPNVETEILNWVTLFTETIKPYKNYTPKYENPSSVDIIRGLFFTNFNTNDKIKKSAYDYFLQYNNLDIVVPIAINKEVKYVFVDEKRLIDTTTFETVYKFSSKNEIHDFVWNSFRYYNGMIDMSLYKWEEPDF